MKKLSEHYHLAKNKVAYLRDVSIGEEVVVKYYPVDFRLESGSPEFEVEALSFLSTNGFPVPTPFLKRDDHLVFSYQLLPGKTPKLSLEIVKRCGAFLREMLQITERYIPEKEVPDGDLDHILRAYRDSQLKEPGEMCAHVTRGDLRERLERTPKGIVHGDYFAENLLVNGDDLALIDFGDAYYGHLVMDIVIGAMEFSVLDDESWDLEFFKAFIDENREWLQKNQIDFELFYDLLLVNCFRFAIYLLPEDKCYVIHFHQLKDQSLKESLEEVYPHL